MAIIAKIHKGLAQTRRANMTDVLNKVATSFEGGNATRMARMVRWTVAERVDGSLQVFGELFDILPCDNFDAHAGWVVCALMR